MDHHTLPGLLTPASTLARYGSWIRKLPDTKRLLQCLQPPCGPTQPQEHHRTNREPEAHELMRHLYKRCPAIQVRLLDLSSDDLELIDNLIVIAEFVAPHTHHIRLTSSWHSHLETWKIKYLLEHCSSKLEELTLDIHFTSKEDDWGEEQEQEDSRSWTRLKQLNLRNFNFKLASKLLGSWLWERCGQVEKLTVHNIFGITGPLDEYMSTYMPGLNEIHLGTDGPRVPDDKVAMILSGSRNGWKVVEMRNIDFGEASRSTLSKHFTTLERLLVDRSNGFASRDMVQALSSCPNLHALVDLYINSKGMISHRHLNASVFIDQNPISGLLDTWSSETTLKELSIVIRGIPRADLEGHDVVEETYPGQGRDIQSQVYERLARLTHLEILRLGYTKAYGFRPYIDDLRLDCLEMSLESGLWKLEGLRSLQELDVARMRSRIGLKEVQWMVAHWPKLKAIRGLEDENCEREAIDWILEHHPEINLEGSW